MRIYKDTEWDLLDGTQYGGFDDRTYVDLKGKLITGLLENYYYYKKDDIKNWEYIENRKRKGMLDSYKEYIT